MSTPFGDFVRARRDSTRRAIALRLVPPGERSQRLIAEIAVLAGRELTHHLARHDLPVGGTQRWHHPVAGELRLDAEVLELPAADAQQLVVFLPADGTTADALVRLRPVPAATRLHVVSR